MSTDDPDCPHISDRRVSSPIFMCHFDVEFRGP